MAYKDLKGAMGDHNVAVRLVDNLAEEHGADGRARKIPYTVDCEVEIDSNLGGAALLNTVIHEFGHILGTVYGLNDKHKNLYPMAAGLTQLFISTGLIDAHAFEARFRKLTKK